MVCPICGRQMKFVESKIEEGARHRWRETSYWDCSVCLLENRIPLYMQTKERDGMTSLFSKKGKKQCK